VHEIAVRLHTIRLEIAQALARSRAPGRSVTIVAVTKQHAAAVVDAVAAAGIVEIGENRVAEAVAKAAEVRAKVRWHLIGHLQRNKARRAAGLFDVVHSVDSPRLLEALAAAARPIEVFLQINVSGERSKGGVPPEDARALRQAALGTPLEVVGLMTMAPVADDPESARPHFRALREIRDALNESGDGHPLRGLSMGMSGDYAVAVEEGATHVRIGTALVGTIPPDPR
jgi:pyridoxal phosphate enzyme (YggS family)